LFKYSIERLSRFLLFIPFGIDKYPQADLKNWLKKVGLPYHSPHKFRHGHAVYALKMAKDIQALKAVSQNLMHKNLSITDGLYGIFLDKDIKEQIVLLGNNSVNNTRIPRQLIKKPTKHTLSA
jgi:integrase